MLPMEIAHAILTAKIVKKSWTENSLRKYSLISFFVFLLVAGGNSVLLNLLSFRKFSNFQILIIGGGLSYFHVGAFKFLILIVGGGS